jgi:hypothetical protein
MYSDVWTHPSEITILTGASNATVGPDDEHQPIT